MPGAGKASGEVVYLVPTGWDDWFKFSTLFNATYVDSDGHQHHIGGTKIGQMGLLPARADSDLPAGVREPNLPTNFTKLRTTFFSLGQDTTYYEALTRLGSTFREQFLGAMRDLAYDAELLKQAVTEPVTRVSLLREVPLSTVQDQFARLARGGATLTPYNFAFRYGAADDARLELQFSVKPKSRPPSNIHVIVGRNGVGKSTLLNALARAMVITSPVNSQLQLANVVSVSFSAFDIFEPITVPRDRTKRTYHYVGLKKIAVKKDEVTAPKDHAALSREMTASVKVCLLGARRPRLQRALRLLEGDPIFAEAGLADLVQSVADDPSDLLTELPGIFRKLSSGHKIVLLTVTKLVETVEEKSLVLLDEPEAHLHPPLLSAFIRALSDLLTNRNGMAIVATHSPVVLQEVPRSCVWKLQRHGNTLNIFRPEIETFGENVGTLTDEVFGLEVTATGFHKMLADEVIEASSYEEVLESFAGQLGAEGRAILRAMIRNRVEHVGG